MKRFISLILLLLVFMATFSDMIVWTGFTANRELITNLFCENKEKPELECNGMCHIKKKIEQALPVDNGETPVVVPTFKLDQVVIVSDNYTQLLNAQEQLLNFCPKVFHDDGITVDVFHPPRHSGDIAFV